MLLYSKQIYLSFCSVLFQVSKKLCNHSVYLEQNPTELVVEFHPV